MRRRPQDHTAYSTAGTLLMCSYAERTLRQALGFGLSTHVGLIGQDTPCVYESKHYVIYLWVTF